MTNSGCVCSLPMILEPSHIITASQKTYMMLGVPKPARNKKATDSVVKIEPIIATSDLNQRLRRRMRNSAVSTAIIIDGNLMEYKVKPNTLMMTFCMMRYGKSITWPFVIKLRSTFCDVTTDCISSELMPPGAMLGKKLSNPANTRSRNMYPKMKRWRYKKGILIHFFTVLILTCWLCIVQVNYSCLLSSDIKRTLALSK